MSSPAIEFRLGGAGQPGDARSLAILASNVVLTRLIRPESSAADDFFRAPLPPLGIWLADNWWRLRFEARPAVATLEWRDAHEMTAVGAGYSWPRVTIWGDGSRIGIAARADPVGIIGPVRFLQDALLFVDARDYEAAVDAFLDTASADAVPSQHAVLTGLINALRRERDDISMAAWRRLEAMAGFDVDAAPDPLLEALGVFIDDLGQMDVEEAVCAAPGPDTANALARTLEAGAGRGSFVASFSAFTAALPEPGPDAAHEPWMLADQAAATIRARIGQSSRPLRNKQLADLLSIDPDVLSRPTTGAGSADYGVRLGGDDAKGHRLVLHARRGAARRFEMMRAVGDAIWAKNSRFGPISSATTARQKFQRAFAASFLCPPAALTAYLGGATPTEDDISDAARHFHVSERVVRSVLVNKRLAPRDFLQPPTDPDLEFAA